MNHELCTIRHNFLPLNLLGVVFYFISSGLQDILTLGIRLQESVLVLFPLFPVNTVANSSSNKFNNNILNI